MKMVLMNGLWSGRIWTNVKNGEGKEDENVYSETQQLPLLRFSNIGLLLILS